MSQLLQVAARRQPSITGVDATTPPFYVSEGIPYDAGGVAVDSVSPITHHHQGLPFTANGRIAANINSPTYFGSGAAPFAPTGRLSIQTTAVDSVLAGVPFTITSGVRGEANTPSFGPELITNGEFVDASGWSTGTGWIIQNCRAECNSVAANNLEQSLAVPLVRGKTYQLDFDMLNYVSGEIVVRLTGDGFTDFAPAQSSDGHYTGQITATGNYPTFRARTSADPTNLMVDNFSLKEVL